MPKSKHQKKAKRRQMAFDWQRTASQSQSLKRGTETSTLLLIDLILS